MTATMIKIERNEKMEAAIVRCRKTHPTVRRIDANTVTVTTANSSHTVRILQPREGLVLAECDCPAGQRGVLCYHCAAALVAPVAQAHKLAGLLVKRQPAGMRLDGIDI